MMNTETNKNLIAETVRAAMFGHAIADALGVPVEFRDREELRKNPVRDYRGYGSHPVPAGTWSDDTSMALATLDSLSHGLDYEDIMRRFCDWRDHAAYTATDAVFDIGITTNQALSAFCMGTPALECGQGGEYDNGNGSLMRIIPAALYCQYAVSELPEPEQFAIIHAVSALTHSHPRSEMACGIYACVLRELLADRRKESIQNGLRKACAYYESYTMFAEELIHFQRLFEEPIADFAEIPEKEIQSSGYVVATLEAAIWCVLNTGSYEECVLKAVNLGRDTDTVGAVAGGLAGCLYGMDGIPKRWYDGLLQKELIENLCEAFTVSIQSDSDKIAEDFEVSKNYLSFSFSFVFTAQDLEMFRTGQAQTSFGFYWKFCDGNKLLIIRGRKCFYSLSIDPETGKHRAVYYLYCSMDELAQAIRELPPEEYLLQILTKWTGHESFLRMADIHSHIVYDVDDGAWDLAMSMAMIEKACEQGVRDMICTSHSWGSLENYREHLQNMKDAVTERGLPVQLYPGCEIECDSGSIQEILSGLQNGMMMPLGVSDCILLEFSTHTGSESILQCVRQLMKFGAIRAEQIILAHVERYQSLSENEQALHVLEKWGCRFQINAYSLEKESNPDRKNFARRLLMEKRVSFLGSDAHQMTHRAPDIESGIRYIYDHCDVHYANAVCHENAERLLLRKMRDW